MVGKIILHYKITEKLGEGGMGVVYRAEDAKLKRDVAIKFLPRQIAASEEERARFKIEAQAAAALSHPNIATIFAIEEHDDEMFIVMESIEGKSIEQILRRGEVTSPVSELDKAIDYATQIAAGLQAAHEKGITHRDIKSSNIMVTDKGQVKIMDFGLAKLAHRSKMTVQGTTLGTAAYMSPEQARGEEADNRSDIWSLGVVLYEMISGQLPFKGDYEQAVIYSIQNEEPLPLTALRSGVPIALDGIIAKALAKDPATRYQHVDELPADLKALGTASLSGSRISTVSQPSEGFKPAEGSRLPWIVAGVMAIAFTVLLMLFLGQRDGMSPQTGRLNISAFVSQKQQLLRTEIPAIAVSPDGDQVAYAVTENGVTQLFVRPMNSFEALPISGTTNATSPFFSPDGQWLAFLADGKLKKVAATGGAVETLCDAPGFRGASWGLEETIILSPTFTSGLMSVSAGGGKLRAVSVPDSARHERTHRWPQVLPGGEWVLYTIGDMDSPDSYTNAELAIQSLKSGERHILNVRGEMARYIEPGYLVVARNGALLAAPFSLKSFRTTEPLQLVIDNVAGDLGSGVSHFDLSRTGKLVYIPGARNEEMELVWIDRQGKVEPLPLPRKPYSIPRISPDGKKLAVTIGLLYGTNTDIWLYDLTTGVFGRFTFGQSMWSPVWSKDSKRIFFSSALAGKRGVMVKPIDGSRAAELILPGSGPVNPISISSDGTQLILNRQSGLTEGDILLFDLNQKKEPVPLIASPYFEYTGINSPGGHFITYGTNESGRFEVIVSTYPHLTGKWQVSNEGGLAPMWAPDGKALFYYTTLGRMMSVVVQTQPVFSVGKSRELFDVTQMFLPNTAAANYDVTPDGQRFIMVRNSDSSQSSATINVILNWGEELRGRFEKGKRD